MAFKLDGNPLAVDVPFTVGDVNYPANWLRLSTAQEKKNLGITEVADAPTYDNRFYWAKGIERKLADENVVDDDGKAVIDPMTGKQMVQLGLKSIWIAQTKTSANSLLSSSDWYVTRKAEANTAIPSDISKYRTDVRTASKTIEDKINACSKLADFKKLFDVPVDSDGKPTGNAPIFDYPDEV